jgi:hypothetical protein
MARKTQTTYRCACGTVHTIPSSQIRQRRLWGSTRYAPWFEHQCPACDRFNLVHDGMTVLSLQGGKALPGTKKGEG